MTLPNSIASKITHSDSGCWLWSGYKNDGGYGQTTFQNKRILAHRLVFLLLRGSLPEEKMLCHRCDTPACVNPDHLFPGTGKDNMQDCLKKGRKPSAVGALNPRSKLKPEDVEQIRVLAASGCFQRSLAKTYNVSQKAIWNILNRKAWTHTEHVAKGEEGAVITIERIP